MDRAFSFKRKETDFITSSYSDILNHVEKLKAEWNDAKQ